MRDVLGNISPPSTILISNIDTSLPNAPVIESASSYTAAHWYNTDITVTASFTPTDGCAEKLQYQIDSGSWTDGNAATFTESGVYALKFRVIDELGRTSSVQSCTVQIDKQKPSVSAVDTDYSWRNSPFHVTIQFEDAGGSGVATMQYALTGSSALPGTWIDAAASQNISIADEGQWYVHYRVTDGAGNAQTGYYGPYKLDQTNPTGSASINPDKTNNGIRFIRDRAATVALTAEDGLSGAGGMRLAESLEDLAAAGWIPAAPTHTYTFTAGDGLKTLFYQVKDAAGNLSPVYSDFIYLDTSGPTISISAPSQPVAKRGEVVQYTVTFDDNSKTFGDSTIAENNGIESINLTAAGVVLSPSGSIDINDITVTVEPVPEQPLQRLIKLALPAGMQGEGSINLKIAAGAAEDKAGNLSAETLGGHALSIDNVPPSNQDLLFSENLRVKGGSEIALNGSSVDFGGHESDSIFFAPAAFNGEPANGSTITGSSGSSSSIDAPSDEGEYYLFVMDRAGNISPPSAAKLTVDNTGPVVTISPPDKTIVKADGQIDYTVTFAGDTLLSSIDSLFTTDKISLHPTGTASALVNIVDVPGNAYQKIVRLSNFSGDGVIKGITLAADICRDEAGNGSLPVSQATELLVDCTKPLQPTVTFTKVNDDLLSRIVNFITFGYFFNAEIKVKLHAEDINGSGLANIYYKTDEAAEYAAGTPDAQGNVIFTLPIGFKGYVFAYAADRAGNSSATVKSDGVITENSAPVIQVTPADLSGWFNSDVILTVQVTDNEGLREVRYSVNGIVTTVDLVSGYTDKQEEYQFTIPLTEDSTGHVIQINATDLAGNGAETCNASVKLDKTPPHISGVGGNPADWTGDFVTLVVYASDATSGLAPQAYSFDDGATWQAENSKIFAQNTADIRIKVRDAAGEYPVAGAYFNHEN